MNQLFKGLLISFSPIIIYILCETIWGETWAVLIAVLAGIIELIWTFLKDRKIEKIIIFDVILLTILGGLSYFMENSIFFKFKPAVLQMVFIIIIGIHLFTNKNILFQLAGRQMKNFTIGPEQMKEIDKKLFFFFWILIIHTGLIIYSALYLSPKWWNFIAGFLLYILLGIWILWQFVFQIIRNKFFLKEEWFNIVNEKGEILGKVPRSVAHNHTFILHPVVHLHVFNSKGEILAQKRSQNKDIQPGKWDTAVGGHISLNESVESALFRESEEELGLVHFAPKPLFKGVFRSDREQELVYSFQTRHDGPFHYNKSEITDVRFFTKKEIESNPDIFTPNFIQEFKILKSMKLI